MQYRQYIGAFILFGCAPSEHSIYIIYFMLIIYDDEKCDDAEIANK